MVLGAGLAFGDAAARRRGAGGGGIGFAARTAAARAAERKVEQQSLPHLRGVAAPTAAAGQESRSWRSKACLTTRVAAPTAAAGQESRSWRSKACLTTRCCFHCRCGAGKWKSQQQSSARMHGSASTTSRSRPRTQLCCSYLALQGRVVEVAAAKLGSDARQRVGQFIQPSAGSLCCSYCRCRRRQVKGGAAKPPVDGCPSRSGVAGSISRLCCAYSRS